jgi:hypothetical protein
MMVLVGTARVVDVPNSVALSSATESGELFIVEAASLPYLIG